MKKDLVVISIAIFLLVFLCMGTKIQSVDDYYLTHIDNITEDSETVFLTIDCSNVLNNWDDLDENLRDEKYVPKNGKILKKTEYVLRKGDTVYDILSRAVRYNKIHMETINSGSFNSVYIQGINHLYEYSCGPLSGWIYMVNGQYPNYGCSNFVLKDGDNIEWIYSCELGEDIGNNKGDKK